MTYPLIVAKEHSIETVCKPVSLHPLVSIHTALCSHSGHLGNLPEVHLKPLLGVVVPRGPCPSFPSARLMM